MRGFPLPAAAGFVSVVMVACGGVSVNGEADQDAGDSIDTGGAIDGGGAVDGGDGVRTFLYVTNFSADSLSVFEVDGEDGSLTSLPAVTTGGGPWSVTVDRSGRFLYVVSREEDSVYQYEIDSATGAPIALTPPSVDLDDGPPFGVMSPGTKYLHVPLGGDNLGLSSFEIPAAGTLQAYRAVTPTTIRFTVASADDTSLIVGVERDETPHQLAIYSIDPSTGDYAEPVLVDLDGLQLPITGAADPGHEYFFAVLRNTNEIQVFEIDSAGPGLEPAGDAVATGDGPFGVAVHPTAQYLYVANFFDYTVNAYEIANDGGLTFRASVATGGGPEMIAFDASGRFMYIPNFQDATISAYEIDPATGVPAPLGGSLAETEQGPLWIVSAAVAAP